MELNISSMDRQSWLHVLRRAYLWFLVYLQHKTPEHDESSSAYCQHYGPRNRCKTKIWINWLHNQQTPGALVVLQILRGLELKDLRLWRSHERHFQLQSKGTLLETCQTLFAFFSTLLWILERIKAAAGISVMQSSEEFLTRHCRPERVLKRIALYLLSSFSK